MYPRTAWYDASENHRLDGSSFTNRKNGLLAVLISSIYRGSQAISTSPRAPHTPALLLVSSSPSLSSEIRPTRPNSLSTSFQYDAYLLTTEACVRLATIYTACCSFPANDKASRTVASRRPGNQPASGCCRSSSFLCDNLPSCALVLSTTPSSSYTVVGVPSPLLFLPYPENVRPPVTLSILAPCAIPPSLDVR